MNEFLLILRDILGGMFNPKKFYQSIYERELDMKPLFLVVVILGLLSMISMLMIRGSAIAMLEGNLPAFVTDNYDKFQLITTSSLTDITTQVVYSLLVTLLITAAFLKILVLFVKAGASFKKCLIIICYSWGPNILVSLLLTLSILILPIERTMFAKGLFEVWLGESSMVYNFFTLIDPFYVWSITILATYMSYIPNRNEKNRWHYWIYVIYIAPMILNLLYLS